MVRMTDHSARSAGEEKLGEGTLDGRIDGMKIFGLLALGCLILGSVSGADQARPNILWITSEDNAAQWVGCYGNAQAKTPRIDKLAESGHRFAHAYSNAPVCAVARSTLLNGVYAPAQGTQHMRSRHPIPKRNQSYVSYLRKLGYYCTNRSKTDFNFEGNDRGIWDECGGKAHYRGRKKGQPFFAVFNFTTTHESSLFPAKRGEVPTRLKPSEIEVPAYLPDLPEVREDFAVYHDKMTKLDGQLGQVLDELEKEGLGDDTIVFYYSDHGGPTPRGKRYLKETGVRVPLIVHVPEKWAALTPFKPGQVVDEPVAFVDFAPTLLSLAGRKVPGQMQGRAFLGAGRVEPQKDDHVFLYADRFDEFYGMRRGLTDGRWKYIRRFTPQLPAAPYSFYQFSMPSWVAYRKAWQEGRLEGVHKAMWEAPQAVEELFDLKADPWEVNNLAADPAHKKQLEAMCARLKAKMIEVKDSGVVPEPMFEALAGEGTIADFVRSPEFDLEEVVELAFAAASGEGGLPRLIDAAASKDPVKRYWGLQGLLIAGDASGVEAAKGALDDAVPVNRASAAEGLCAMGQEKVGHEALFSELERTKDEYSLQYLINAIIRTGAASGIPDSWVESTLKDKQAGTYVKRFAQRLKDGEI